MSDNRNPPKIEQRRNIWDEGEAAITVPPIADLEAAKLPLPAEIEQQGTSSWSDAFAQSIATITAQARQIETLRAALKAARPYVCNVIDAADDKFNWTDLDNIDAALKEIQP